METRAEEFDDPTRCLAITTENSLKNIAAPSSMVGQMVEAKKSRHLRPAFHVNPKRI